MTSSWLRERGVFVELRRLDRVVADKFRRTGDLLLPGKGRVCDKNVDRSSYDDMKVAL